MAKDKSGMMVAPTNVNVSMLTKDSTDVLRSKSASISGGEMIAFNILYRDYY
jgi:hypothetical protein